MVERRVLRALRLRVARPRPCRWSCPDPASSRPRAPAARRGRRDLGLRVLHDDVVDLGLGRALGDQRLGALELVVDLGLERLERLRAREELAVDEERRRPARADLAARGRVRLDLRLALLRVERRLELAHVQAQLLRVLLVGGAVHRLLVGEDLVVHLPELALLARGARRDRRRHGVRVERQRQVAPGDADLALVLVHDLGDGRLDARAERALEVGELHDRDERVLGALDRRALDLGAVDRVRVGLTLARAAAGAAAPPCRGPPWSARRRAARAACRSSASRRPS